MAGRARSRLLLLVMALALPAVLAAAYLLLWQTGWLHRFDVGGVKINPRARIRDDAVYELAVWEEEVPAPWARESQRAVLERAVQEFSELHANARVTVELLDEAAARDRLAAALASGAPPDVYGAARTVLWGLPRQVPASPYLPPPARDEPPAYDGPALDALTARGAVWGWPRGLWWDGWLARKEAATGAGWTYDDWRAASGPAGRPPLSPALDYTSLRLLEQLMGAAGFPSYADADGGLAWDREQLTRAAAWLRETYQAQAAPGGPDAAARRRLERLLSGDADVLAPVNPYAAQSAMRLAPGRFVVVPPPRPPEGDPVWPVEASAYFVFHQTPYKGDDHTRLAAALAAFLAAKTEAWLVEAVGLLPVTVDGWQTWSRRAPWDEANRDALLQAARRAAAVPPWGAPASADAVREALLPLWRAFMAGETTPEDFADDVLETIERVLDPEKASR